MKKQALLLLELIISIAIVAAVLNYAGFEEVIKAVEEINIPLLVAGTLCYVAMSTVMAYRLRLVLSKMGHKISMGSAILSNYTGLLVSDFTPARSGYFAAALAVSQKEKIPLEKTTAAILAPQMFDFLLKVITGTMALVYLMFALDLGEASIAGMFLGVIAIAGMIVFGVLLLFSKKFLYYLTIIQKIPLVGEKVFGVMDRMQEHSQVIKTIIPEILVLLLISWFFKVMEWVLLAEALGMQPQTGLPLIIFFAFLQPLITILQFVPSPTLAGIGLAEAGAVAVLAIFGVPPSTAAVFSLLTRANSILVDLVGVKDAARVVTHNLEKLV